MVNKITWEEFRNNGMLWWINQILHTFGLAIVFDYDENGNLIEAYPARVRFRGFGEKQIEEGYIKVSQYLKDNCEELLNESKE